MNSSQVMLCWYKTFISLGFWWTKSVLQSQKGLSQKPIYSLPLTFLFSPLHPEGMFKDHPFEFCFPFTYNLYNLCAWYSNPLPLVKSPIHGGRIKPCVKATLHLHIISPVIVNLQCIIHNSISMSSEIDLSHRGWYILSCVLEKNLGARGENRLMYAQLYCVTTACFFHNYAPDHEGKTRDTKSLTLLICSYCCHFH